MATTSTPAAPQAAPEQAPKQKKQRAVYQDTFPTQEEAVKAAEGRVKGPRRAFKVVVPQHVKGGTTHYVVHNNEGRASGVVGLALGFQVEEIGKAKKAKLTGVDGIMAAVNALPEAEKKSVLEALKSLAAKK